MCENRNKCGAIARKLHEVTGFCPYGTTVTSETSAVSKKAAKGAEVFRTDFIPQKVDLYKKGTGKPDPKWKVPQKFLSTMDDEDS